MTSGVAQSASSRVSIRIAGNFTVEPITEFLANWMTVLGIDSEIQIAPYNQVFQQLLEGGLLWANRGGVNLVALDLDAWLPAGPLADARPKFDEVITDFVSALRTSNNRGADGVVLVFPVADHPNRNGECASAVTAARDWLLEQCRTVSGWGAVDLTSSVTRYSVSATRDPFTDELGNIPFTEEMYAAAATTAARWIHATYRRPRKVVVLDCDNTLWQGVCGEGPIEVTPPFRRLQEFMIHQRDNGMLLALVSKNNERDVMEALESDVSVLRPGHFASWRINWKPKSENLESLAEEFGLALSSFILVDDSLYECMEVRNRFPEVFAIELPSDSTAFPGFLDHMWIFDRRAVTDEDRNRARMYDADRRRNELSKRALTIEEFLASLHIEIQFIPAAQRDLMRIAQLTQRTTQFNSTGILHTEQSLSAFLAEGRHECWTVRVRDIFGDYGLVGVVLFETVNASLQIQLFLLSCRALGRRVEHDVVDKLKQLAIERGADRLVIPVVPTARNSPAQEFLASLCGISADARHPFQCVLSATSDSSEWRPEPIQPQSASESTLPELTYDVDAVMKIAAGLQTASSIIAAVRERKRSRPALAGPLIPPSNATEEALVRIWSDCLRVEPVGTKDNFFDFGGDSLRATRVLTRMRAEFGIELNLAALFKTPTIQAMAARICEILSGRTAPAA